MGVYSIISKWVHVFSPSLQVSIVPRTNATLGYAQYLPSDQKLYTTEQVSWWSWAVLWPGLTRTEFCLFVCLCVFVCVVVVVRLFIYLFIYLLVIWPHVCGPWGKGRRSEDFRSSHNWSWGWPAESHWYGVQTGDAHKNTFSLAE